VRLSPQPSAAPVLARDPGGAWNRSSAYLTMLCVGTALFRMFFFRTLFMQAVWGYGALKAGVA
jgi:hypothetical protein